jgi:hypothetical protein
MTTKTQRAPLALRFVYALPILGQIARDIATDKENIFYALMIFVTLIILAVNAWGIVALAMSALAMVPVMFTLLLMITRG